jgi:hypothetical protein
VRGDTEQDELMIRYLLGEAPEQEMIRVETRFLSDGDYFDRLLAVEDALVDEYVRNEMPAAQRTNFEALINSSGFQRGEVEFTRGLLSDLKQAGSLRSQGLGSAAWKQAGSLRSQGLRYEPPRTSRAQGLLIALALVSIVAIALGAWSLHAQQELKRAQSDRQNLELRANEAQRQLDDQSDNSRELSDQLAAEKELNEKLQAQLAETKRLPDNEVASIFLKPALITRGASRMSVINLGPEVRQVRMQLGLQETDRYAGYGVAIRSDEQRTIWSKTGITRSSGNSLSVIVPAQLLPTGDYIVALTGLTDTNKYSEIREYVFGIRKTR